MQLTKDTLREWYMSQKKECYCYYLNMFYIMCISICLHVCMHIKLPCLGRYDKGIRARRIIAADSRAPPFGYCERSPEGHLNAESYLQFQNVILTKHAWPRQLAWISSLSHHYSNTETGAGYMGFLASEITCTWRHEDFCQVFFFLTPGSSFSGAFRKSSEARPLASHNYLWKNPREVVRSTSRAALPASSGDS